MASSGERKSVDGPGLVILPGQSLVPKSSGAVNWPQDNMDSERPVTPSDRQQSLLSSPSPPSSSIATDSSQLRSATWVLCKGLALSVTATGHAAENFIWPLPIDPQIVSNLGNIKELIETIWKCCFIVCENSSGLNSLYSAVEGHLVTLCNTMMQHVSHSETDERQLEAGYTTDGDDYDDSEGSNPLPEGKLLANTSFALRMCWNLFFQHSQPDGTYASVASLFDFAIQLFQLREIRYELIMRRTSATANSQTVIAELFLEAVWNLFTKAFQLTLLQGEPEKYLGEPVYEEELFENCWILCEVLKVVRKTKVDATTRNHTLLVDSLLSRRSAAKRPAIISSQTERLTSRRKSLDDENEFISNPSKEPSSSTNLNLGILRRRVAKAKATSQVTAGPEEVRTTLAIDNSKAAHQTPEEPLPLMDSPEDMGMPKSMAKGQESAPPGERHAINGLPLEEKSPALGPSHGGEAVSDGGDHETEVSDNRSIEESKTFNEFFPDQSGSSNTIGKPDGVSFSLSRPPNTWADLLNQGKPPTAPRNFLDPKLPSKVLPASPVQSIIFAPSIADSNNQNNQQFDAADIDCLHHIRLRLLLVKTAQKHGYNKNSSRISFYEFVRDMPRTSFGRSDKRQKLFSDFRNAVLDPGNNLKAKGDIAAHEASLLQIHRAVEWKLSTKRHKFLKDLFEYVTDVELGEVNKLSEDEKHRIYSG